jgi:uncharacterized protein (DUF736 family)
MTEGPTMKDWEDRRGWTVLFKNRMKSEDRHPDFTGVCVLETGQKVSVAAWKRKTKNGDVFLSVSIQAFRDRPQPARKADIEDDDL